MSPFLKFILKAIALYVGWVVLYDLILHPYTSVDKWVIRGLISTATFFLELFGYDMTPYAHQYQLIGIKNTGCLKVDDECDGMILFGLFIIFLIAYGGKLKNYLWFMPLGLLSIFMINVVRICALVIILSVNKAWIPFNHHYTFQIIVFSFVFYLWYLWAEKVANKGEIQPN